MHRRGIRPRVWRAGLAAALVVAFAIVATPAHAAATSGSMKATCEPQVALSVEATAAYDSAYGRYLDGIISNDSTVNVNCPVVQVSWLEDSERTDKVWPRADGMEPGQWTAFHLRWPKDVPAEWTPVVSAAGNQTDRSALRLRVDEVSEAGGDMSGQTVSGEPDMRSYIATVTNDAAFPVSSIELIGAEWDGDTFVDATFSGCAPSMLAPGQSARIEFHAKAPTSGSPVPDVFVEARERPTITLKANTLSPYYGSAITFTLALKDSSGQPIVGWRTLKLFYSADKKCWNYVPQQTETGTAIVKFAPDKPLYFKALYWGDDQYGMTESAVVRATPKIVAATPQAPSRVNHYSKFKVSGRTTGGAKSAGKPVYIRMYRYSRARHRWIYKGYVKTAADSAGRYSRTLRISKHGSWKLRTYRAGAGYSKYEYLKIK